MQLKQVPSSTLARVPQTGTGVSRASREQAANPVQPTDLLKDPTSSEYRELRSMKQRDREVRQHEQAHLAAGGAHVNGGATFGYETGPDGRRYAVSGEVSIDAAPLPDDPEATIRKMQVVRSAALAPAEPSAQDRAVAVEAAQTEAEARAQQREMDNKDRSEAKDAVSPDSIALNAYREVAGQSDRRPTVDITA
jgi:hypothetical protein